MIVVVGSPQGRVEGGVVSADGLAIEVAIDAAAAGRRVQIVGRIGDDAAADAVLQDLARRGVDHVAILRDAAHVTPLLSDPSGTEPAPLAIDGADVELALRYLIDFAVIVVVDARTPSVLDVAARAASWGQAALIVVVGDGTPTEAIPETAHRLMSHPDEPTEAFATRIANRAVELGRP